LIFSQPVYFFWGGGLVPQMVLKTGDSFHLLGTSCKKCKFPLLNADLDRDEGSIACR
jgi:hypothetical protein